MSHELMDPDNVSTWCYDGMCQHCDHDWCQHRCHRKPAAFSRSNLTTAGLMFSAWAAIGAMSVLPDSWPDLTRWSLLALGVLIASMPLAWIVMSGRRTVTK